MTTQTSMQVASTWNHYARKRRRSNQHRGVCGFRRRSDRHTLWRSMRVQCAFEDSMFQAFHVCNSHYVSHLVAFFIDARAKRSTVRSCSLICLTDFFFRRIRRQAWNDMYTRGFSLSVCVRSEKPADTRHDLTIRVHSGFPKGNALATVMILPQVHLRKPCYDFYFL